MLKHVILWKIKEEYQGDELCKICEGIKESLEGLMGVVPGLTDIHVYIGDAAGCTADLMLDSTFVDEDALKAYGTHPAHVHAADNYVRPYTQHRSCVNYFC